MSAAIFTRHLGPTNNRGGRVVAETTDTNPETGRRDRVYLSWDSSIGIADNHRAAARKLLEKLGWDWEGVWVISRGRNGYIFSSTGGMEAIDPDANI